MDFNLKELIPMKKQIVPFSIRLVFFRVGWTDRY